MKKGFTLMEVLVVVIMLGVIASITFPIVKNIVNENRRKTFEASVRGIIRSTDLYISSTSVGSDKSFPYNTTEFIMEKNSMTGGSIEYNYSTGKISVVNLTDGNFCANGTKNNLTIEEGAC